MLLLDEPTNHLDAESVEWLEQFLQKFPGTVVAVTHDRYFLDNAAEWILELDRGYGIPWKGNYSSWLEQKEARLRDEAKQEAARMKAMKKELEWVRQNPKGRQAKSKARLARFEELSSYEYQKRNETQEIFIPVAERLGDEVIEFKDVCKGYGDRLLIDNLSFNVPARRDRRHHRPERRRQVDAVPDDHRHGKAGPGRDRHRPDRASSPSSTSRANAARRQDRVGGDLRRPGHPHRRQVRDAVARLPRPLQLQGRATSRRTSGTLSGGERGRLHLAKTLLQGGNVLLLDEPSNDLDVETLRALEDALLEFAGSVLVISHDRWFLDRIATHILAFEGDSQVVVLRRQLPGIRGRQEEAPRRRGRAAAPHPLQGADGLSGTSTVRRAVSGLRRSARNDRRRVQSARRSARCLHASRERVTISSQR